MVQPSQRPRCSRQMRMQACPLGSLLAGIMIPLSFKKYSIILQSPPITYRRLTCAVFAQIEHLTFPRYWIFCGKGCAFGQLVCIFFILYQNIHSSCCQSAFKLFRYFAAHTAHKFFMRIDRFRHCKKCEAISGRIILYLPRTEFQLSNGCFLPVHISCQQR